MSAFTPSYNLTVDDDGVHHISYVLSYLDIMRNTNGYMSRGMERELQVRLRMTGLFDSVDWNTAKFDYHVEPDQPYVYKFKGTFKLKETNEIQ